MQYVKLTSRTVLNPRRQQTPRPVSILALLLAAFFLFPACAGKPAATPPPVPAAQPRPAEPAPREIQIPPLPPTALEWKPLIRRLALDGFDPDEVAALFANPSTRFDPAPMKRKLWELYKLQYKSDRTRVIQVGLIELGYTPGKPDGLAGGNTRRAIQAFQKVHGLVEDGKPSDAVFRKVQAELAKPPAERKPGVKTMVSTGPDKDRVYPGYLTKAQLDEAEAFMKDNRVHLDRMEKRFGVPGAFVVGILRIETHFGRYLGDDRAFPILASMALCSDFAPIAPYMKDKRDLDEDEVRFFIAKAREKGDWAYDELKALLIYAKANRAAPLGIPGSIYGAIGISQFMPSNAVKLGADGDGDGKVNLFNMADAIHSVGSYFKAHGWQGDMSDLDRQREVIYSYNRSTPYVNTVMAVAHHLLEANP